MICYTAHYVFQSIIANSKVNTLKPMTKQKPVRPYDP